MKSKFDFFSDAGHGWAKVPKSMLSDLGIAGKITSYSYQRGEYAYLEEDCDLDTFFKAYEKNTGKTPKLKVHNSNNSRVRSYERYQV